jgi:hypothetical protein
MEKNHKKAIDCNDYSFCCFLNPSYMEQKLGVFMEGGMVEVRTAEGKNSMWLYILNKSNSTG